MIIYFSPSDGPKGILNIKPGLLVEEEETIGIPKQDDQKLYEWIELYRFNPLTNSPIGEAIDSARITPEGLTQRNWLGVERQLLRDYMAGIASFDKLRPVQIKVTKSYSYHLLMDGKMLIQLVLPLKSFNLKQDDNLSLLPEKETKEGTDFLLTKDGVTLARYRLDLKTKKFTCIGNLTNEKQFPEQIATENDSLIEEYKNLLLAGQIMSLEEFVNMKERQHD